MALALFVVVGACSGAAPPRTLSPEGKLEWAIERFEEGDYASAKNGLREFLINQPLHPLSDSAQYLMGEANFRDGKYLEAAEAFSRLSRNRPTSTFADDAQLGACRSYWRLAPDLPLDQSYTRQAEEACVRLLRYYTPSPLEGEARELLRKARDRLAQKRYRTARWYYDLGAYESANIYLEDVLENYPSASIVPEVLLTLYRSYRELGFDAEADQMRQRLLQEFANSKPAAELQESEGGNGSRAGPR